MSLARAALMIGVARKLTRWDERALAAVSSGGGTRAAALSYGVMPGPRDTRVPIDDKEQRLLDAVSAIGTAASGLRVRGRGCRRRVGRVSSA